MQPITHIRNMLENPESSATVLMAFIRQKYGDKAIEWDPLTIHLELKDDYAVELSSEGSDKVAAMQVVLDSDAFFTRIDAFFAVCNTLASNQPYFVAFDPVTTEEAAWAITEVALNRDILPFSYAIKEYIHTIAKADGYSEGEYPDALELALTAGTTHKDILRAAPQNVNRDNVEGFVNDKLRAVIADFDNIPDLDLDKAIYKEITPDE